MDNRRPHGMSITWSSAASLTGFLFALGCTQQMNNEQPLCLEGLSNCRQEIDLDGSFNFRTNDEVSLLSHSNLLSVPGANDGTKEINGALYVNKVVPNTITVLSRRKQDGRNFYQIRSQDINGNQLSGWVHESQLKPKVNLQQRLSVSIPVSTADLSGEIMTALNRSGPQTCVEIILEAGTYTLSTAQNQQPLVIDQQASADCPNVIRGVPGQTVITRDSTYTESMVSLRGARYLKITGMKFFEPSGLSTAGKAAIHFDDLSSGSSHIEIVQNEFEHTGAGIWVKDDSSHLLMAKNTFKKMGSYGTWYGEGIQIGKSDGSVQPHSIEILGNSILGAELPNRQQSLGDQAEGIEIQKNAQAMIADNTIVNPNSVGILAVGMDLRVVPNGKNSVMGNRVLIFGDADNGIQVASDVDVANNLIAFYNPSTQVNTNAITVSRYADVNSGRNLRLENNTIFSLGLNGGLSAVFRSSMQAGSTIRNNAIYALNQTIASGDLLSLSGSIQDPTIIEQNVSNPHQIDRGLNNLLGRSLFEDLEVEPSMLITTGRPHLNSSLCDASLVAGHFRLDMNGTKRVQCMTGAADRTSILVTQDLFFLSQDSGLKTTTALDESALLLLGNR